MQAQLLRSLIICAALVSFGATAQTYAAEGATTVTCKDGTSSKAGRGACSHHGGVQKNGTVASSEAAAAAPAATMPAATPSAPSYNKSTSSASTAGGSAATEGAARAKCRDGTVSHSRQHRGACSHHGGVAQ